MRDLNDGLELGTNLGELFKDQIKTTKLGTKVQDKEEEINKVKEMVKDMKLHDHFDINKQKVIDILTFIYSGKALENQIHYLDRMRTTQDLVSQGYNIILSREESLRKVRKKIEEEYE